MNNLVEIVLFGATLLPVPGLAGAPPTQRCNDHMRVDHLPRSREKGSIPFAGFSRPTVAVEDKKGINPIINDPHP